MEYYCIACGREIITRDLLYQCPNCNSPLFIKCNNKITLEYLKNCKGFWDFYKVLPNFKHKVTLGEGNTPTKKAERLGNYLKLSKFFIKDETRNPTGSFIDRGSAVLISAIKEYNYKGIVVERGGNLGASLSAYASIAGLKTIIKDLRPYDVVKIYQMIAYGALINHETPKSREFYYVKLGDPLLIEGYKTIIYELIRDLGPDGVDNIIVPVGSGTLLISLWKGLRELKEMNVINSDIRLFGVQSEACEVLVKLYKGEKITQYKSKETIASDLVVENPPRVNDVLLAIKECRGELISVSDSEIVNAMEMLAKMEGILAEPSAAVTLAGLIKLLKKGVIDRKESTVIIITGSGLKSLEKFVKRLYRSLITEKEYRFIGKIKREILRVIREYNEIHGYKLWKIINSKWNLSKTAVYKHLYELEKLGLIKRRVLGRRVLFSLTLEGERIIETLDVS